MASLNESLVGMFVGEREMEVRYMALSKNIMTPPKRKKTPDRAQNVFQLEATFVMRTSGAECYSDFYGRAY